MKKTRKKKKKSKKREKKKEEGGHGINYDKENIFFLFNLYLLSLSLTGHSEILLFDYLNIFKGLTCACLCFFWLKYPKFWHWIILSTIFSGLYKFGFVSQGYTGTIIGWYFLRIYSEWIYRKFISKYCKTFTNKIYKIVKTIYYMILYVTLYYNMFYIFNVKMDMTTSKFVLGLVVKHLYVYNDIDIWEIRLLLEIYIASHFHTLIMFIAIPLTIKIENLNLFVGVIFWGICHFYPLLQFTLLSIFLSIRLFKKTFIQKELWGYGYILEYVLLMYPQVIFLFTGLNIKHI